MIQNLTKKKEAYGEIQLKGYKTIKYRKSK